jgi:hypothetical protein
MRMRMWAAAGVAAAVVLGGLRQLNRRHDESRALTHLGDAHIAAENLAAARRAWKQALAILDDLDDEESEQLRAKIAEVRADRVGVAQGE